MENLTNPVTIPLYVVTLLVFMSVVIGAFVGMMLLVRGTQD